MPPKKSYDLAQVLLQESLSHERRFVYPLYSVDLLRAAQSFDHRPRIETGITIIIYPPSKTMARVGVIILVRQRSITGATVLVFCIGCWCDLENLSKYSF